MKKKILITVLVLIALIGLGSAVYTVGENEYACTVRFSKIIGTEDTAGLHFKVPFIDSIKTFPKATMLYDIPPSEVLTSDKQNMTVDCYVLWRVSNPLTVLSDLGLHRRGRGAPGRPDLQLSEKHHGHALPSQTLSMIEDASARAMISTPAFPITVDNEVAQNYGIHVVDIKIKRFDLPESNLKPPFTPG